MGEIRIKGYDSNEQLNHHETFHVLRALADSLQTSRPCNPLQDNDYQLRTLLNLFLQSYTAATHTHA